MSSPTASRSRIHRSFLTSRIAVIACAAAISLAACSSGGDSGGDSGGASAEEIAPRAATGANEAADSGTTAESRPDAQSVADLPADALAERAIERHGSLDLSSDDVGGARNAVVAATGQAGGYVASENSTTGDHGDLSHTSLQVVVPTDRFDSAMSSIADAGTVLAREQSAEDVTDEVVDVDSRVESAQSSLQRVRLLLGRAESLGDVIRLESVLGERQADLEALQARQQSLAARTSTATIDVAVRAATADPQPKKVDDDGFVAGLSAGWNSLTTVGTGLLTGLGAVLPFVLAIGVPAVPVALLVRRTRRRGTAEAT